METPRYRGDITPTGQLEPFRIAARDKVHPDARKKIEAAEGVVLTENPAETQAVVIRSATKLIKPEDFDAFPQLRYAIRAGVGVDNIGMHLAALRGIATVNTPGASTEAVAQRSLAFILAWAGRFRQGTEALMRHTWPKNSPEVTPVDLGDKTLGIVGHGRIGRATHDMAQRFFGRVLYNDIGNDNGITALDDLLPASDVVSLSAVPDPDDPVILTAEKMRLLKPLALLVNTARGVLVDHPALLEHMNRGGSAALDVYPEEGESMFNDPIIEQIMNHPNFLGTPHTAASGPLVQKNLGIEGADRAIEFAQQGIVNPGSIQGHTLPELKPQRRKKPGLRIVLTHPNVPGMVSTITQAIEEEGINLGQVINEHSETNGKNTFAMSIYDLDTLDGLGVHRILEKVRGTIRAKVETELRKLIQESGEQGDRDEILRQRMNNLAPLSARVMLFE